MSYATIEKVDDGWLVETEDGAYSQVVHSYELAEKMVEVLEENFEAKMFDLKYVQHEEEDLEY